MSTKQFCTAGKPHTTRETLHSPSKLQSFLIFPKPWAQLSATHLSALGNSFSGLHVKCLFHSGIATRLVLVLLSVFFEVLVMPNPGALLKCMFITEYVSDTSDVQVLKCTKSTFSCSILSFLPSTPKCKKSSLITWPGSHGMSFL